ncbi:MAG: hypothetical protein GX750_03015 [Clostridia bacterium]|nr:hypothetical protein [Clostridia bacterium]
MPRCLNCGNTIVFGSTKVPTTLAWQGSSGFVASFDSQGNLVNWENRGADQEVLQYLTERPNLHLDSCLNCGSGNVVWP